MTSSKQADTLICHTTMCRNPINFLYNSGHVTLWCVEVCRVVNSREGSSKITTGLGCNKPWALHSHWMCRFQHLTFVDFNKPWAGNSQNTVCSLQLMITACHCIKVDLSPPAILVCQCHMIGVHYSVVMSPALFVGFDLL